ncbi:hypothetical protein [Odoribacter laneus]|uniref:hypothetical protein n=1 Tax=Odoribacter laneus TaxID=626933 RepID=UPI00033FA230|nr:hypothetical protein [Odoribacter laneus]CCZ80415.1 putative uncharacterized protein [Odoribacter laneus CAG:561]
MEYFEPNVVIVDDKKNEVQGLIDYYQQKSVGCKYFNADLYNGDLRPDKTMSDVMLLYLDLFYSGREFDPELCTSWVRTIIPPGSFYILVLWTKDISLKTPVIEKLREFNLNPYILITESKEKYIIPQKYDYSSLIKSINEQLEEVSPLEEILIWKNVLKKTANIVLGTLIADNSEEFTAKLKKIIIGQGGKNIKDSDDPVRKRSVLFEALNSVLASNIPQHDSEYDISEKNKKNLYNLSEPTTVSIDRKLNSWFHFTLKNDLKGKTYPGIIAKNTCSLLKNFYSIKDDEIVEKVIAHQLVDTVVIEDIVLNITRPCDYAQNKFGKNLKLLSGIVLKKPVRKENAKKEAKLNRDYDCILILDHLFHDETDDDLTYIFDMRYSFSLPESVFLKKFENIKMFNKELFSEIQVAYGSYVNRPGHTNIF